MFDMAIWGVYCTQFSDPNQAQTYFRRRCKKLRLRRPDAEKTPVGMGVSYDTMF